MIAAHKWTNRLTNIEILLIQSKQLSALQKVPISPQKQVALDFVCLHAIEVHGRTALDILSRLYSSSNLCIYFPYGIDFSSFRGQYLLM